MKSMLRIIFAVTALSTCVYAQQASDIHVLHVQGNVYMVVGAVGNIAVQVGSDGILMVDTGSAQMTDQVLAAVKQIAKPVTNKPLRYIINTHFHPDHTGGNEKARLMGKTITGGNVAGNISDASEGAAIYAHANVLKAMSAPTGKQAPTPAESWPTDTYFSDTKELFFNGEALQMLHPKSAHTDGDSIVFFRRSDVVMTGDIFSTTTYPIIDLQNGGSLNGIVDALNFILDITIPADKQEGGTMVIPGHGRLCDEADVVEYRDMVTIIRDRIQDMVKKGMTLEQVKAAKPTRDYDPLYGATTGFWTTDMFVEAAYKSLSAKK
ncbi:MAG TPA: MBL fold metallo-hydrolase [Terriglobia bacterium]|jgi:glyoxylase-like metal-dependent hydrolase (beta-lactamase superfamily II)